MEYYWTLFNSSSNSNSNSSSSSSSSTTSRGHIGNFTSTHAWDSPWDLAPYYSDPHLTCLKLGKRLSPPPPPLSVFKRGRAAAPTAPAAAPRCQVEGCEAPLLNAKDYHRRHKVCEMHAKAPRVVLLGIDQRFCQQCSRFHAVAEFDEAKRSCRRRLAGHNERRRKSSQEHATAFGRKQYQDMKMAGGGNSERALSLLSRSPASYGPWSASPSAALRELIAENRASVFACRQLEIGKLGPGWAGPENRGHVTLNLMQGPDSAFGLISGHGQRPPSSEEDGGGGGDCSELWKLPFGY